MKHIRIIVTTVLFGASLLSIKADALQDKVENGIERTEQLVASHLWQEAFAKLREADTYAEGRNDLKYLVEKQRYSMYSRLGKKAQMADKIARMEALARATSQTDIIEDMLITKAQWAWRQGMTDVARGCYTEILNTRSDGKDDNGRELCFKQMIQQARKLHDRPMEQVIGNIYASWLDSIAAIRATAEIRLLKDSLTEARQDISLKQDNISSQKWWIAFLSILAIALAAALALLTLVLIKNLRLNYKLRQSLKISNEANTQKSHFMSNISQMLQPSLDRIARGNDTQAEVEALSAMLHHIERYMNLEQTRDERYETSETNIGKLCEQIVADHQHPSVEVHTDAPKISFPINSESVSEVLSSIINDASAHTGTQRITLSFRKRNPHTAQFLISAAGMELSEQERSTMFTAFSLSGGEAQNDGMLYPTCAIMAYKMGGELTIDESFHKGVRFMLEVKN